MAEIGARPQRKLGLRTALTALVLLTVTVTALVIHLLWAYTARQNVTDVADQLNREIVSAIRHELRGILDNAVAAQEAVRSIFFQGTIDPMDEAKREFVFLSLLRSQPSLSWISFGWPDGSFFGALKAGDQEIQMIEVKRDPGADPGELRIDHYVPEPGDIVFQRRVFHRSGYSALDQAWYRRAVEEDGPGWTMLSSLPNRERQAISTSTPLYVYRKFRGVINVVIELERLSRYLADVRVGKTGTVVVLDRDGHVVASADPAALRQQQSGQMPDLSGLAAGGNRLLGLVARVMEERQVRPVSVSSTRRLDAVDDGEAYFVTFSPLDFRGWVVATVIPHEDFLASIERNAQILLAALVALTLAMAALATVAANRLIGRPLLRIAGQLKHIEGFRLERVERLRSPLRELDGLSAALLQMSRGLASFRRYMPTELVRTLVSQGIEAKPGGHHEELTVLFTDVAGFTGLSEKLGEDIVPVLGEYLELASRAVLATGGTIDKFIGDAVMAFWGAPLPDADHAAHACRAALECRRLLAEQRARAEREGGTPLSMRVGINTGRMLVGNIGSSERLSYTVIGDAVNLASRLEGLNKRYGTEIVIGEETRRAAGEAIRVRRLDRVAVYGRSQGVAVYELLGMAEEIAAPEWVAAYEAGLDAYGGRRWTEALAAFERAATLRPGGDPPARLFAERCQTLLAAPPAADWTPLTILMEK